MSIIKIDSLDMLESAAKEFLALYRNNTIFAFYGDMGAGKTTFIKALCRCLGVPANVNSPSFSIINEYSSNTGNTIYHFDFYRIKNIEEAFDVGYEDYFYSNNYCFIEWPEKVESLLPENTIRIKIEVKEDESRIISKKE